VTQVCTQNSCLWNVSCCFLTRNAAQTVFGERMNLKLEELRRRLLEPVPAPPVAPSKSVYHRSSAELYGPQRPIAVEAEVVASSALGGAEQSTAATPVTEAVPEERPDIKTAMLRYVERAATASPEEESMDQNSQYQLAQAVAKVFDQTKGFQERFGELIQSFDQIEKLGQSAAGTLGSLKSFEHQLGQLARSFEPMRAFQVQLAQLAQSFEPMKGLQQQLSQLSEAFQLHLGQLVRAIEPAKEFQLQILRLARMFDSATELQDSFAQLMETFKGGPLSGRNGVDAAPVQTAAQH